MAHPRSRRAVLFLSLASALVPLAGCGKGQTAEVTPPKPYEGQYKNAKGVVVLEIKEGRAMFTNPTTKVKSDTSFSLAGENQLVIESSAGVFTLTFTPPDTIAGLPASIGGDATPLKKVP